MQQCRLNWLLSQGFNLKCVTSLTGRRKTVTAPELNEFKAQTECLGWSKPYVLNSDHGEKKKFIQSKNENKGALNYSDTYRVILCSATVLLQQAIPQHAVHAMLKFIVVVFLTCALHIGNVIQNSIIYIVSSYFSNFLFCPLHRL